MSDLAAGGEKKFESATVIVETVKSVDSAHVKGQNYNSVLKSVFRT